jgi:hypothetical protein
MTQTKEQVTREFTYELQALLDKYGADITAKDVWPGYAECGEDIRIVATIPAICGDGGHNCLRERTIIDFGDYILPTNSAEKL